MPPYGRPPDVVFDHAVAQMLLAEIHRTIASVGDAGVAWHRVTNEASTDWAGSLAATYRADELRWRSELGNIVAELAHLASTVEAGVAAAIAEHHRIQHIQAEWDAEAAREAHGAAEGD